MHGLLSCCCNNWKSTPTTFEFFSFEFFLSSSSDWLFDVLYVRFHVSGLHPISRKIRDLFCHEESNPRNESKVKSDTRSSFQYSTQIIPKSIIRFDWDSIRFKFKIRHYFTVEVNIFLSPLASHKVCIVHPVTHRQSRCWHLSSWDCWFNRKECLQPAWTKYIERRIMFLE